MIRKMVLGLAFCLVVLNTTQEDFGAGLWEPLSLDYDPLVIKSFQPLSGKTTGYKEMRELVVVKASALLEGYLGKSYWTKKVAPIFLNSLCSTIETSESGKLTLKNPSSVLDETANQLVVEGKEQLASLSEKNLPDLPMVGNLGEDFAQSQYLKFSGGTVSYRMKMRKRLAPEFKIGQFALCGGTETFLNGKTISSKSVASIKYKGTNRSYRVQFHNKNIRFDVSWSPVDLRLDWNQRTFKFDLSLDLGSWL